MRHISHPCLAYRLEPSPQAFESSGAHIGVGSALLRAAVTLDVVEAEEIWVEATAPVRTRAATTARTISFMTGVLLKLYLLRKISLDRSAEVTIRWSGL